MTDIKKYIKIMPFIFLISFFITGNAYAWTLGGHYNKSDPNFNRLAMRVYSLSFPYIYIQGVYTYNAIPIATISGCKLITVIRRTRGFPKPAYWAIENYKICSGSIVDVKNTNMAGWDNLPKGIKPVISDTVREAKQYGRAKADYYNYSVMARTGAYADSVYVYVLNGIRLEAIMKF